MFRPYTKIIAKSKKNPIAKILRTPEFRKQVVKPKKGKGSYSRKSKSKRR